LSASLLILVVGSFDELAVDEGHRGPGARLAGPLVTPVRSLTVAKVDLIGLLFRRWTQWSAG
jgi:hypothetical protein